MNEGRSARRGRPALRRRFAGGMLGGALLAWLVLVLEGGLAAPWPVLFQGFCLYGAAGALAGALLAWVPFVPLPALAPGWPALAAVSLVAAGLLGRTTGPAATPPPDAPEILLVTCDTTRNDRWWAVAESQRRAEGARALEAQAAVFRRCYAAATLTAPSHASLFTGRLPSEHGVFNNGAALDHGAATLAECLRRAGWTTLAAPSVIHLDPSFGFAQGFERFAAVEDGWRGRWRATRRFLLGRLLLRFGSAGRAVRPAAQTLAAAAALWRDAAAPDRPRFLWLHLFDPHWPYEQDPALLEEVAELGWPAAPAPGFAAADVEQWRRRYDAGLLRVRRLLGEFLEDLEQDGAAAGRRLWVVFTSDHGEAIGEHGAVDHGDLLYEEQLRVPLWLELPGVVAGALEIAEPVSSLDLYPSLCELLGVAPPAGLAGRSFAAALRGGEIAPAPLYAETRHRAFDNAAVIHGEFKLIRNLLASPASMQRRPGRPAASLPPALPWTQPWELYHLGRDPLELAPAGAGAAPGREELEAFLRRRGPAPGADLRDAELAADVKQALAELGYL